MKLMRFTFLSLIITSSLVVELNAQERGGRGEGQRNVGSKTNVENHQKAQRSEAPKVRIEQTNKNRIITSRPKNEKIRQQPSTNQGGVRNVPTLKQDSKGRDIRTERPHVQIANKPGVRPIRKEPIKINNSNKQYSYSKPVKNFDHKRYNSYHFNNVKFYGQDGVYYRHYNNSYVRFMPPVGFRVNVLPAGFISINLGSRPLYFYEGIYYEKYINDYRVIEPPMGAIVYALPYGYEKIDYYGEYLYEYAGVLYDKIYHRGERVYQVVGYLS
ncbi:DUF6515 family protein [Faecalibacter bovis]|uniref:Uncharacterized protein n=1 Tax=Faecalibacter bovis TaxID=2898187 RepID=A0ABX7XBM6_9FLAO|nr:DUF6515 family protein [Faecalibacter bovis]QTV05313.1 hypothetical protein J9309_11080 [Faecalibacter bovis]